MGIEREEHQLFITDIAMSLKAEAYGPQEVVIKLGEKAEKMYIMQKGVVAKGGNIISGGNFFGADIILAAGRRTYMVGFDFSKMIDFSFLIFCACITILTAFLSVFLSFFRYVL